MSGPMRRSQRGHGSHAPTSRSRQPLPSDGGNTSRPRKGRVIQNRIDRHETAEDALTIAQTLHSAVKSGAVEMIDDLLENSANRLRQLPPREEAIMAFCNGITFLVQDDSPIKLYDRTVLAGAELLLYWTEKNWPRFPFSCVQTLRTLCVLLTERGASLTELFGSLLGVEGLLIRIAAVSERIPPASELDCARMAINCMASMCAKPHAPKVEKHLGRIMALLQGHLTNMDYVSLQDKALSKLLSSTLRAMQVAIVAQKKTSSAEMDSLVPILCEYMFHGVPRPPSGPVPYCKVLYMDARQRSSNFGQSSDSEVSDIESGTMSSRTRSVSAVRLNALACMQAVVKHTPKKDTYKYWTTVGLTSDLSQKQHTLLSVIKTDPDLKVRVAALGALSSFLDDCAPYLSMAEEMEDRRVSSYTPQSYSLAITLRHVHEMLLNALQTDPNVHLLCSALKCVTVLLLNTPYSKLSPGLLQSIVDCLWPLLYHQDLTVLGAAIMCIGALSSSRSRPGEVAQILRKVNNDHACCLATRVADLVKDTATVKPLRTEAMTALCCISRNCVDVFETLWQEGLRECVFGALKSGLESATTEQHTLQCAQLLEEYLRALNQRDGSNVTDSELWNTVLVVLLPMLLSNKLPSLRAVACDMASLVPMAVFESLEAKPQRIFLSMLLGLTADAYPAVAAASLRALGAIVVFPSNAQDGLFVQDIVEAIAHVHAHENLTVKVRAFWALANTGDAIVKLIEDTASSMLEATGLYIVCQERTITEILQVALAGAQDHEKVRQNAVRALGSFGRLFDANETSKRPSSPLPQSIIKVGKSIEKTPHILEDVVNSLSKNVLHGSVKLRWNACHAIGNILRNERIFPWGEQIMRTLCRAITECKNFKVRINATAAVTVPKSRAWYSGDGLATHIFETLIYGLEHLDDMDDFGEFKYRNQLDQQLKSALQHLFSIFPESNAFGIANVAIRERIQLQLLDSISNDLEP